MKDVLYGWVIVSVMKVLGYVERLMLSGSSERALELYERVVEYVKDVVLSEYLGVMVLRMIVEDL